MRILSFFYFSILTSAANSQPLDEYTGRYSYAFVEDTSTLVPMRGRYSVEYLARGQWWSYTDPRLPVNYAGKPLEMKPLIAMGGSTLLAVEPGKDHSTTDQKLRVVRGVDTLIVDLSGPHRLEARLRERTAGMELPPRPPLLLPFRRGWSDVAALTEDSTNVALSRALDRQWQLQRTKVLALYDTARYTFDLLSDDLRVGPLDIFVDRDPNYRTQMLLFPASGPGVTFELARQDNTGVPEPSTTWRVEMPKDGETARWVDVTAIPSGKYTARLLSAGGVSTFHLLLHGPARPQ